MKALVLFSGGLDSTIRLLQRAEAGSVLAVTFDYGQSCAGEIVVAQALCQRFRIPHQVVRLNHVGTDATGEIPGRNLVFVANAVVLAKRQRCSSVVMALDPRSPYADCGSLFAKHAAALLRLHGLGFEPWRAGSRELQLRQLRRFGVKLSEVHSCRRTPICFRCRTCRQMSAATRAVYGLSYRELMNKGAA